MKESVKMQSSNVKGPRFVLMLHCPRYLQYKSLNGASAMERVGESLMYWDCFSIGDEAWEVLHTATALVSSRLKGNRRNAEQVEREVKLMSLANTRAMSVVASFEDP